jgi:HEPN domain-containing protein
MRPMAEPWWEQAQADLAAARWNIQGSHYDVAAERAQQAAEKGLKALYIEQTDALAPYIHDLDQLGRLVVGVPADVQADLTALNPAFVLSRYPAPGTNIPPTRLVDVAAATAYLEAAERILTWVSAQLP